LLLDGGAGVETLQEQSAEQLYERNVGQILAARIENGDCGLVLQKSLAKEQREPFAGTWAARVFKR